MTTNRLADLPTLNKEIADCRQIQQWATATRSQWIDELEAIRDAATDEEQAEAIAAAEAEAVRLATKVARRLVDANDIRNYICGDLTGDLTDEQDDGISHLTIADLVEWMRANAISIDQATNGARDGWVINATEAIAFASCRSWRGPEADGRWVEIDLLTGEAVAK